MHGSYLGPGVLRRRDRARQLDAAGAVYERSRRGDDARSRGPRRCSPQEKVVGWLQGRMEFGPRALGDRSILGDPRSTEDAVGDEPQDQVPRELPARSPRACSASTSRTTSSSTPTRRTCCWSRPCSEQRRIAMTPEQQRLFGIEKLNVPRSTLPAITHVDYSARIQTVHARDQPALPRAPPPLPRAHRLPRAREHELQRPRRADRVHPDRRLPLLHADGDGRAGASATSSTKERQPKLEQDVRLAAGVRARLRRGARARVRRAPFSLKIPGAAGIVRAPRWPSTGIA